MESPMQNPVAQRIGLVAGAGDIPVYFASKAAENGIRIISVSFTEEIGARLAPYVEKNYSIGILKPNKIFNTFKEEKITDVLMLGKVDKGIVFKPQLWDLRALKFFKFLKSKDDKTLLVGVLDEIEKEGFSVLDQREVLREIYPDKGVLTRRKPTQKEMEDIEYGLPLAKKLADLEIGQTIVVKNKTVIAVEAVEGTDNAVERGCALANGNAVIIKVSRTNQDYRYDSPGIGPNTLKKAVEGGASVLAVEAGCVMVVNQTQIVKTADKAGITIISF